MTEFSFVVAALILVACIDHGASVVLKIRDSKPQFVHVQRSDTVQKFKLRISERGANFDEKVEIDEKNDIEYFQVPPHNELSETDAIYDFRMNITVRRVKKDRVCHISPLPPYLPRPKELAAGLRMLSQDAPLDNMEKITQYWTLGGVVARETLRTEVQEFCGQFQVYRLKPYNPDPLTVVAEDDHDIRADRTRRDRTFLPCNADAVPSSCHPNTWKFKCLISDPTCLYYVSCDVDTKEKDFVCRKGRHTYTAFVCCQPSCP